MNIVTVARYRRFLEATHKYNNIPDNWEEQIKYPSHPVRWVNALDAEAFCEWARISLPTEKEWEESYDAHHSPSGLWEWTSTSAENYRVVRGGPWIDNRPYAVCANRIVYIPHYRNYGVGFRTL